MPAGRRQGNAGGGGSDKKLKTTLGAIAGNNKDDLKTDDSASRIKANVGQGLFRSSQKRKKNDLDEDDVQDTPTRSTSVWSSSLARLSMAKDLAGEIFSSRNLAQEDEDESDEEDRQERSQKLRDTIRRHRISERDLESKRDRAFQALGTVALPLPGTEPWGLRVQRKLGILELRVGLQVKKLKLEEDPPYYKDLHAVVTSLKFEAFFGLLIILNAICIGWDTFYGPDDRKPSILNWSEHVFTAVFLVEFFMRIFAFTTLWLCSAMNLFDTFLIWGTGVLVTWILIPIGIPVQAARRLNALRILRLARLIRAIRIMPFFKELWMLVQGVMECTTLILWAMVIGGMVHFTFAVIVLELITKNEEFKDDELVHEYFGSTIRAMFSLFQIMTLDSWSGILRPIRERAPESMLIFGLFMGISSIVLFNLLIAIVVQNAYDAGERDIEAVATAKMQEQRKVSKELLETFQDLDEDGSGALSKEEFNDCLDDYQFVRKMKMLDIDLEELPDFFDILDDGDGQVDQDEFVGGMMKMQGPAMSGEVMKANTLIKQQNSRFDKLHDAFVIGPLEACARMEGDLDNVHRGMNDIMQLTADVMEKLDDLGVRQILKKTLKDVPFVEAPDTESLIKLEKQFSKKQRRKKMEESQEAAESEYDIDHLVPYHARMQKLIPATWILREGRTYEAKNPGKVRLLKDPSLKHMLKQGQKSKSDKIREKNEATGRPLKVYEEMNTHFSALDTQFDELGTLRRNASQKNGKSPPEAQLPTLVNFMTDCFVPKVNDAGPAPPPKGVPPVLKTTFSYPAVAAMASPASPESQAAAAAEERGAPRMLQRQTPVEESQEAEDYDSHEEFNNARQSLQGDEVARQLFAHPNAVPESLL